MDAPGPGPQRRAKGAAQTQSWFGGGKALYFGQACIITFYEPEHFQGRGVPKLQILTIEKLLEGHRPELPRFAPSATFKQAPRRKSDERQGKLW